MNPLLEDLARDVIQSAQEEAPIRSGELRASLGIIENRGEEILIGHHFNDKITVSIGTSKSIYPLFVHEGTAPHAITPKRKKALHFKGAKHPLRRVNHPGIAPNPYLERSLHSPRVSEAIRRLGDTWLEQVALELERS